MIGLARTDAAAASLLLTLEGVATVLMAWFLFHENFDLRIAAGMECLVAGVAVPLVVGAAQLVEHPRAACNHRACVAWALDQQSEHVRSLFGSTAQS